jgi:hypothetical protein
MAGTGPGRASGLPGRISSFVLVVDSDVQNLVIMSMILQWLDYRVCSALGVGNSLEIPYSRDY